MADPPRYTDTGDATDVRPDRASPPATPRWVKAFGIAFLALVLLIVVVLVTGLGGPGAHGPGRHLSGAGQSAPASVTEQVVHQP